MSRWQVVNGPGGQRYVVVAGPAETSIERQAGRGGRARLLAGTAFLPEPSAWPSPSDPAADEPWEVHIEARGGRRVFPVANADVAERLMVLLGEEIEVGILQL